MGGKTDKVSVLHRFLIRKVSKLSSLSVILYENWASRMRVPKEIHSQVNSGSRGDMLKMWAQPQCLSSGSPFQPRSSAMLLVFSFPESLCDLLLVPQDESYSGFGPDRLSSFLLLQYLLLFSLITTELQ